MSFHLISETLTDLNLERSAKGTVKLRNRFILKHSLFELIVGYVFKIRGETLQTLPLNLSRRSHFKLRLWLPHLTPIIHSAALFFISCTRKRSRLEAHSDPEILHSATASSNVVTQDFHTLILNASTVPQGCSSIVRQTMNSSVLIPPLCPSRPPRPPCPWQVWGTLRHSAYDVDKQ